MFLLSHASRPVAGWRCEVDRVLVVVHGALRDSDRYLSHAMASVAASQLSSRTLVVAPQFLTVVDAQARAGFPGDALYWDVEGWKGGADALTPVALSSFTAMDRLVHHLTQPHGQTGQVPRDVIIFGNSAGGQFVNRYAAVSREPDVLAELGISVRFVISNPSTYLYFSADRPVRVADGALVNRWRYGFEGAPAYVQDDPEQCLMRYLARDVTVVLGAEDSDRGAVLLEVSPPAMAQGSNRLDRGVRYREHIQNRADLSRLPVRHRFIRLPGVGHDARDVLLAQLTRDAMFGGL